MVSRLFVIALAAALCGQTIHAQTASPASPVPGFLLIDMAGNGFKLTTPQAGVKFDVNGDGNLEQVSWTVASSDDAFLAIDLNHNGKIDDGTELFGTYSSRSDGKRAAHGLEALLDLYKQAGGSKSSRLDKNSPLYDRLLAWVDANHNGISEPRELRTLAAAGILEIGMNYSTVAAAPDAGGNVVRLTGSVLVKTVGVFQRNLSHVDLSLQKQ